MEQWISLMTRMELQFVQVMDSHTFCWNNMSETDAQWQTWTPPVQVLPSAHSGFVITCYASCLITKLKQPFRDQRQRKSSQQELLGLTRRYKFTGLFSSRKMLKECTFIRLKSLSTRTVWKKWSNFARKLDWIMNFLVRFLKLSLQEFL